MVASSQNRSAAVGVGRKKRCHEQIAHFLKIVILFLIILLADHFQLSGKKPENGIGETLFFN